MMTAIGVWIYELLNGPAQAFDPGESLSSAFASAIASGTKELFNIPGSADAKLDGFDNRTWLNPEIYHQSFAFEAFRSDIIASSGDELQIIDANAGEDKVSRNGNPHVGSGTTDALIDHGGFEEASATASKNAERHTTWGTAGGESNRGQSQRDLHAAEQGAAAAKHDPAGDESNHGQSQRDLHSAEEGAAAAKQHARHDPAGDDSNRGQSQRDLHASKDDFSTAEQHAKDDARPGSDANSGQSQHDVYATPVNASKSPHARSSQNIGKDQAADDTGHVQAATAPAFGDSFHFKNEKPAPNASYVLAIQMGHGPDSVENGLQITDNHGLTLIQDATDLIGHSRAEQSALDQAKGAEHHHLAHDLFV